MTEFTDVVLGQGCKLSMDGRGAWRDNVFVERLWRSGKYERVYLKAYDGVSAARADIAEYIDWYNAARAHSSLADSTPDEHCFAPDGLAHQVVASFQESSRGNMITPVEDLAARALQLPPEDRARLVERLMVSFEPRSVAQAAWLDLARNRREEVKSGKVVMVPGDEALARVRARLA